MPRTCNEVPQDKKPHRMQGRLGEVRGRRRWGVTSFEERGPARGLEPERKSALKRGRSRETTVRAHGKKDEMSFGRHRLWRMKDASEKTA